MFFSGFISFSFFNPLHKQSLENIFCSCLCVIHLFFSEPSEQWALVFAVRGWATALLCHLFGVVGQPHSPPQASLGGQGGEGSFQNKGEGDPQDPPAFWEATVANLALVKAP